MFDMVRPLVPANGPPGYYDYRYEKGTPAPGYGFPPKEDVTAPPLETAWERGLRHAKEVGVKLKLFNLNGNIFYGS